MVLPYQKTTDEDIQNWFSRCGDFKNSGLYLLNGFDISPMTSFENFP